MSTTVPEGFAELKSRLELTTLQQTTVSSRQTAVRAVVEAEMTVIDSFLTGSYRRSTLIAPLKQADIDIVVVLASEYHNSGATNVLNKVKAALDKKYKTPKVSRNGQAVTITFKDFVVDVVPAFYRSGGGYLICDSGPNKWIPTNPKQHIDISSTHNKTHNGDLVPLIKMLKAWNRQIDRHFRSFHLEVLAWKIFDGITISNPWSGVRYFFDKAQPLIPVKLPDPVGHSPDVASYLYTQAHFDAAVSRLKTAHGRAVKAEAYAKNGKNAEAFAEWRKIFGDNFPAYG